MKIDGIHDVRLEPCGVVLNEIYRWNIEYLSRNYFDALSKAEN